MVYRETLHFLHNYAILLHGLKPRKAFFEDLRDSGLCTHLIFCSNLVILCNLYLFAEIIISLFQPGRNYGLSLFCAWHVSLLKTWPPHCFCFHPRTFLTFLWLLCPYTHSWPLMWFIICFLTTF